MNTSFYFRLHNPTLANRIYRFRIPTRLRATTVIVHVHLVRPHHPPGPRPTILPCTTCPHLPSKQNAVAPRGNDCIPRSARPPVRCMPCCRDRRAGLVHPLVLVHRRAGHFRLAAYRIRPRGPRDVHARSTRASRRLSVHANLACIRPHSRSERARPRPCPPVGPMR